MRSIHTIRPTGQYYWVSRRQPCEDHRDIYVVEEPGSHHACARAFFDVEDQPDIYVYFCECSCGYTNETGAKHYFTCPDTAWSADYRCQECRENNHPTIPEGF